jgi:hypothetical protein
VIEIVAYIAKNSDADEQENDPNNNTSTSVLLTFQNDNISCFKT